MLSLSDSRHLLGIDEKEVLSEAILRKAYEEKIKNIKDENEKLSLFQAYNVLAKSASFPVLSAEITGKEGEAETIVAIYGVGSDNIPADFEKKFTENLGRLFAQEMNVASVVSDFTVQVPPVETSPKKLDTPKTMAVGKPLSCLWQPNKTAAPLAKKTLVQVCEKKTPIIKIKHSSKTVNGESINNVGIQTNVGMWDYWTGSNVDKYAKVFVAAVLAYKSPGVLFVTSGGKLEKAEKRLCEQNNIAYIEISKSEKTAYSNMNDQDKNNFWAKKASALPDGGPGKKEILESVEAKRSELANNISRLGGG